MSKFSSKFELPENFSIEDIQVKNTMLDLSLEHTAEMRIIADFYREQFGIENFSSLISDYKKSISSELEKDDSHDNSIIHLLIESIAIQKTQARLIIESIASNLGKSINEASETFYEDVDNQRYNLYAELLNRNSKS